MNTRRFGEVSVLHLEPETYAKLLALAESGPGRPGGIGYDPDNPWHALIVEPHTYGCWVHTGIDDDDPLDELPAWLVSVLRDARDGGALYVLFDVDHPPLLNLPVFEHSDAPTRPGHGGIAA